MGDSLASVGERHVSAAARTATRVAAFAMVLIASFFVASQARADSSASKGRRVALVIGNAAYRTAPLRNTGNDAGDISRELSRLGFEVTLRKNLSRRALRQAVREFGERARRAEVALFFFAGHGVQVKGVNFLVPVDAELESEADVEGQSVDANHVLETMESSGAAVRIMILDACRNNPFASSSRSFSRGLAAMQATAGTLIAFATSPGAMASDGAGRNGVYTKNLVASLRDPNTDILKVFQRVRANVIRETEGRQVPWESTSLTGDFFFDGRRVATTEGASPPEEAAPPEAATGISAAPECDACPEMVAVPGRNFEVGRFEVTQGQWRALMGSNPSHFAECGEDCPVEQVNVADIELFLARLNARTGRAYRLPTEAEWESACTAAGAASPYCGGDDIEAVAWYERNSGRTTHRVGERAPNAYGLFDMTGNVWEVTADCWPGDCTRRVLKGGSWAMRAIDSRAVARHWILATARDPNGGFRLARTLPAEATLK